MTTGQGPRRRIRDLLLRLLAKAGFKDEYFLVFLSVVIGAGFRGFLVAGTSTEAGPFATPVVSSDHGGTYFVTETDDL